MDDILSSFAHALRDFLAGIPAFLETWAPVLMLFLLGGLIWVALKSIPRSQTKVQTPDSKSTVSWSDVAVVVDQPLLGGRVKLRPPVLTIHGLILIPPWPQRQR